MLLNESTCSYEKAMQYGNENTKEYCHESGSKSPCCGYFGALASDPSTFNLTLLTFKYAIPNFIYTHQPVADYLGLPYDHVGFCANIGMSHMVLMCALPHGKLTPCTIPPEGFDTLWTPSGYCVTFNEKAPNEIYQVKKEKNKIQSKLTLKPLSNCLMILCRKPKCQFILLFYVGESQTSSMYINMNQINIFRILHGWKKLIWFFGLSTKNTYQF